MLDQEHRERTATICPHPIYTATKSQLVGAAYDWLTCLFVAGMVISQFFGVIASSVDQVGSKKLGQDPALGLYSTGTTNDAPYSDRVLVCSPNHNSGNYEPVQLSVLLTSSNKSEMPSDIPGASFAGFRVLDRSGLKLDEAAFDTYAHTCGVAATTMNAIYTSCRALGYNVSEDVLRVVPSVDSDTVFMITDVLPILILPFWDNAIAARFMVPTWNGSPCVVRLSGSYADPSKSELLISGTDRSTSESKTIEWLGRYGGVWRHGWYEDSMGEKWYSFISTSSNGSYGIRSVRNFDARTLSDANCRPSGVCDKLVSNSHWGPCQIAVTLISTTSIVVSNAQQFGLFLFYAVTRKRLSSRYDWNMALSNASTGLLIFRWFLSLLTLHRGYIKGESALHHIGIGALSNSSSFAYLPILLLPRLTTILSAFFTIGCAFQGDQLALSETWFIIYPAIVELTLIYYSLINTLAKVLRRRVSDVLFAPTILVLLLLHVFRDSIAAAKWFDIPNNFVPTMVSSNDMAEVRLHQFFTTDIALRLNGGVTKLFVIKLLLLGVSLVPLLLARQIPARKELRTLLRGAEKALAIRASNLGGLGRSQVYDIQNLLAPKAPSTRSQSILKSGPVIHPTPVSAVLSSYEIVRLGYIAYGGKYLISMDDWDRVSMLAGVRNLYHLWNHRVVVFELHKSQDVGSIAQIGDFVTLKRVDDPKLLEVSVWDISACSVRC